jgi:hypothetical protein
MPVLKFVTDENTFEGLGGEGANLLLALRSAKAYWLRFQSGSIDTTVVSAEFAGTDFDGLAVSLEAKATLGDAGTWAVVGSPKLRTMA